MNTTRLLSTLALFGAMTLLLPATAQEDPISAALRAADDLAEQGRFREALAALQRDAAALQKGDPEGWAEHGPRTIALYRKLEPAERRFEEACAAAKSGQKEALIAWVREVEGGTYEHAGYAFIDPWRIRARTLLGDALYKKILQEIEAEVVQKLDLDEVKSDPDATLDLPQRPKVVARGSAARRERLRVEARMQTAQLGQMRVVLGAAERLRLQREEKAQALAVGQEVDGARVERWDAQGFALARGGQTVAQGWDEADPALAVEVRALGAAPDDGQALHDLALFALERGRFEEAERFLGKAVAVDPAFVRPDLDLARLRRLAAPFQGELVEQAGLCAVTWGFDRKEEERDFPPMNRGKAEVLEGALRVKSDGKELSLLRVRGQWSSAVEVQVRPAEGFVGAPHVVALSCPGARLLLEVDGAVARLQALGRKKFEEVKTAGLQANAAGALGVTAAFDGRRLHLRLDFDGEQVLTHSTDWVEPTEVMLGTRNGEVRLDAVTVRGVLRRGFLEEARGAGVGEVVRALTKAEGGRRTRGLPCAYWETSAEDDVGIADVVSSAIALVAEGRDQLLLGGGLPKAGPKFTLAADKAPEFAAAVYLEGRARLDAGDLHNALERAETAMGLVEEFHEAMVLRAAVLLRLSRVDEAEAMLQQAAALAPGSPALWRARADLLRMRGDLRGARDACATASVLAVEDPVTAEALRHLEAIVAGPAVLHRSTHGPTEGGLTFVTDLPPADRDALRPVVEEATRLPATLREAFPVLARDRPARPYRLVLLASHGAFHRWLSARGLAPFVDTFTHVDSAAADVVVLHGPRAPFLLRRCLVLAWLDDQNLGLPHWARDSIAGVIAERTLTDVAPPRHRLRILATGWALRPRLIDVATGTAPAAEQALPGLGAALGWALLRLCLEPGAKGIVDEEEVLLADVLTDYLKRVAPPLEGNARLEHAWVETFYRLDPDDLDAKLLAMLKKLAAEQGVAWPE